MDRSDPLTEESAAAHDEILECHVGQVVVNYASSAGPAQEVADAIKASGGDAIVVGADMSKKEDIDRRAGLQALLPDAFRLHVLMLRYRLFGNSPTGWLQTAT